MIAMQIDYISNYQQRSSLGTVQYNVTDNIKSQKDVTLAN